MVGIFELPPLQRLKEVSLRPMNLPSNLNNAILEYDRSRTAILGRAPLQEIRGNGFILFGVRNSLILGGEDGVTVATGKSPLLITAWH